MSNRLLDFIDNCINITQSGLGQACLLCGRRLRGGLVCADCMRDLPLLSPDCCPGCALPSSGGALCGNCLRHPPAFDRTIAVFSYAFPLDALIRDCKYGGNLALTDLFAERLAVHLADVPDRPDLLIPMPLHPARLSERGFNQAVEIGRRLAQRLKVEWRPNACQRVRDTPPQAGLDLKARRHNLRGAFACDTDLTGRRVALIDDVMTSGASLDELARVAKRSGARGVQAWVVARTP